MQKSRHHGVHIKDDSKGRKQFFSLTGEELNQ